MIAGPHGAGKTAVMLGALGQQVITGKYVDPQNGFENLKTFYAQAQYHKEVVPNFTARAMENAFSTRFERIHNGKDVTAVCSLGSVADLDLLDAAKRQGYHISLYYFGVENWKICETFIRKSPGHWLSSLSSQDIFGDYHRSIAMLPGAILQAHTGIIYDNSSLKNPKPLLTIQNGRIDIVERNLPKWVLEPLSRCL